MPLRFLVPCVVDAASEVAVVCGGVHGLKFRTQRAEAEQGPQARNENHGPNGHVRALFHALGMPRYALCNQLLDPVRLYAHLVIPLPLLARRLKDLGEA